MSSNLSLVRLQVELLLGEERVDGVDGGGLEGGGTPGTISGGGHAIAGGRAKVVVGELALALAVSLAHSVQIFLFSVAGESSLAAGMVAAGAGGVGDAKLARMEEEGIGVCNVELFFFLHQALTFTGEGLEETFTEGTGHVLAFFGGKV